TLPSIAVRGELPSRHDRRGAFSAGGDGGSGLDQARGTPSPVRGKRTVALWLSYVRPQAISTHWALNDTLELTCRRSRKPQHHHGEPGGRHEGAPFFSPAPILGVKRAKLFNPSFKVLKALDPAGLHADQHIGDPRLDRDRLVLELCVNTNHREALHLVLLGQR